jgi:hypothetical protein
MLLDPESKQYVAINIHRGLTRHESFFFGKASSHAIFQCTMKICIGVREQKNRVSEQNLPDFCILPNQANSLLNQFGNFRKANNVFPHCPIFFSFFTILSYIFFVFQFIFPTFSQLTFNICPTYFQNLPCN